MYPTVDIIIVNWNAGQQLLQCLASIAGSRENRITIGRVVVVDNASTDGSLEGLEKPGLPLHIIRNPVNKGFAAACNQGARECSADYLLFLNPDTVLFKGSLRKPVEYLLQPSNSNVGIAGIQLVNDDGRICRTCARLPRPCDFMIKMLGLDLLFPKTIWSYVMNEWEHDATREVDHVIGAFYLIRHRLFRSLGGFDERYFVYLEDLDLSLRARQAGWKIVFLADAQAYHKEGGTSEQVKAARLWYALRSRILYSYKHFGRGAATAVLLGTLFVEPVTRSVYAVSSLSGREIAETAKGFFLLWKDLPNWIRQTRARTGK